jgi:hypothetical protein
VQALFEEELAQGSAEVAFFTVGSLSVVAEANGFVEQKVQKKTIKSLTFRERPV